MADSQQGKRLNYDALVIGSGLSGLYYCLALLESAPKISIALISKGKLNECNSYYAQGGIASAQNNETDLQSHVEDTLKSGAQLSHPENTKLLLSQGHAIIKKLTQYQVNFDKENDEYHLAQEGGHKKRRIYHCGDKTGKHMITSLINQILKHPQITCFENHTAVNLIKQQQSHSINKKDEILGAYILNERQQKIDTFLAKVTILASGGAGKVYRYTTNPDIATGDGLAMAYRSGARVGNMEFFQFHPTLLFHPTLNNFLISEAVRGEGAILKNASGHAFMQDYEPVLKDLATRDIVARAIFNEIENSNDSCVFLDIRHQPKALLKKRFPQIFETLKSVGIDMSKDLIPVVPAAHYMCGGVLSDPSGETDLKRLFTVGEVAFSGLHGANRLASNSLLEACAMAQQAANKSMPLLNETISPTKEIKDWYSGNKINQRRASQINAHWRGLRGEMMSYAGIIRTKDGLEDLFALIQTRKKIIEDYYWQHCITRDLIELRNIICVAELIVQSALNRQESRGGHYREDFPQQKKHAQESVISPLIFQHNL